MKKIYLFILLFSIIFLFPSKIYANQVLLKDLNNPIEINQEFENWNEISQRQPFVLYESGIFKLWYASYNGVKFRIVYGESSDLKLINTKKLININYDETYDFHDPSILKIGNKYELYFAVSKNESSYKILKAVSDDGINFVDPPTEVLSPGTFWDNYAVSSPNVFYENSKYYLLFSGWNGSEWKLGLAISENGTEWKKCDNNPIVPYASGPTVIKQGNKYVIYYHSHDASNISSIETTDQLSCTSNWVNNQLVLPRDKEYDTKLITDPALLEMNNTIYLLYSGLSNLNKWTLNIATEQSNQDNKYIILIPGFMTSWSRNSLIYNQQMSIYDWKILDFIKEYNGIIQTIENAGYKKDEKLFVFAYDWRKPIEISTEDLRTYLDEKIFAVNNNAQVFIVGHSFGGLIGRIYSQKYPQNVTKVITVGSPHKGTAQVYKAVQAGDIDGSNGLLNYAQNIVINLNRDLLKSDKEIVNTLFPSLIDIYPNYSFLYDMNNILFDINSLKVKNNTLKKYDDISNIKDKLYSLYSDSYTALFGYITDKQSDLNYLLENYVDGEPIEPKYTSGDKNLTSLSTNIGSNSIKIAGDHEEIIYKKGSIKKILELLEVNIDENNIIEGSKTVLNPSIILFIKSPAQIEVEFNNNIYKEENGLIFIENASSGNYNLKVKGLANGQYTVLVGLFDENSSSRWVSFKGTIDKPDPTAQVDTYQISFNRKENIEYPINKDNILYMFTALIDNLESLKIYVGPKIINSIIDKIQTAKTYYINKQFSKLNDLLKEIHNDTIQLRNTQNINVRNKTLEIVRLIEQTYSRALKNEITINKTLLIEKKDKLKNSKKTIKNLLNQASTSGIDISLQLNSFDAASKKLKKAVKAIKNENFVRAKILLISVQRLFKEIRREFR